MQFRSLFHCLILCALLSLAHATAAPKAEETKSPSRVALVIGNDRYEPAIGPLRNTGNDAKSMAKALRALGFVVIEKHNVTRDELLRSLVQFRAKLNDTEVALFYFAGHGISVSGANYLLPIRSGYVPQGGSETDRRLLAETKLFNAEQAVAEMAEAKGRCNLVILDACRTTPVARDPQSRDVSSRGGLVEMNPPAGSLIAFATDAGHAAADGAGANGLYTEELIKHLLTPGLTIEQVFKRTRAGVMERSAGAQIPAEYSRLIGEDVFLAGSVKRTEDAAAKTESALTIADLSRLAGTGDITVSLRALHSYTNTHGPDAHTAEALMILLDKIKEQLRAPKTATSNAERIAQDCEKILESSNECLPPDAAAGKNLRAMAQNRRGDALLLLERAEDALDAYSSAAELAPEDGYIIYNRGRALLALNRKDEARSAFTTAASAKFKHSGVRKLAQEALKTLP